MKRLTIIARSITAMEEDHGSPGDPGVLPAIVLIHDRLLARDPEGGVGERGNEKEMKSRGSYAWPPRPQCRRGLLRRLTKRVDSVFDVRGNLVPTTRSAWPNFRANRPSRTDCLLTRWRPYVSHSGASRARITRRKDARYLKSVAVRAYNVITPELHSRTTLAPDRFDSADRRNRLD
jgi:hypothetical protein